MQINIKGKNVEVTEALRDYASEKIGKMVKYFDHIISTDVTLSTERGRHVVEVTVYANKFVLRGEERSADMYSSIDRVVEKLERQLKKQKGKRSEKGRGTDTIRSESELVKEMLTIPEYVDEEEEEEGEEEMELSDETLEPRVVRVRRIFSKPMLVAEAIKEMQSSSFSFFVFHNIENDRVNVVYRRARGFGLVDPIVE